MMGPDYTHWHGTYEVAKHFYSEFVPELEELIEKGRASGDSVKIRAAEALQRKLEQVLSSDDHKWYLGRMSDEDAAARQQAAQEFRKRYED